MERPPLYGSAFDFMEESVLVTDTDLEFPGPKIVYVNKHACRLSGFSEDELIGQNPRIFQGPDTDPNGEQMAELKASLQAGNPWKGEVLNYDKNGRPYRAFLKISPIYDSEGNLTNYLSLKQDLSELIQAKERFKRREDYFFKAIKNAPYPIIIYDEDGKVLQTSEAWFRITGYNAQELSSIQEWVRLAYDDGIEDTINYILNLPFIKSHKYEGEWQIQTKYGHTCIWEFYSIPLGINEEGKHLAASMAADVTQLREQQETLNQLISKQRNEIKVKTGLLSIFSHELATPLNPIIGFAELLREEVDSRNGLESIDYILQGASKLKEIMTRLVNYLEVINGMEIGDKKSFNLILEVNQYDGWDECFGDKNIEFSIEFEEGYNLLLAKNYTGYPQMIHIIITNLLENAFKFTYSGTIVLSVKVLEDFAEYSDVRISVSDSGIGIDESKFESIFDPFNQVDNSDAKHHGGLGLGLALARELVHNMHGEITVKSAIDQGSTFSAQLRLEKE